MSSRETTKKIRVEMAKAHVIDVVAIITSKEMNIDERKYSVDIGTKF